MERLFIDELKRTVRGRRDRETIVRELRSHLESACLDLEESGLSRSDAEREGWQRLGDPGQIAAQFHDVYRPSRVSQVGIAVAVAGALVLGMFSVSGSLASTTRPHHAHIAPIASHHQKRHHPRG